MFLTLRLIIIFCLPAGVLAESVLDPVPELTLKLGALESEKKSKSNIEGAEEEINKTKSSANSTERFVMPVTGWIEEKMHNSSVLNPLLNKTKEKSDKSKQSTLRRAILLARERYPGTVLSARKATHTDTQTLLYKIKILSKDGAIQEVEVPLLIVHEGEQP